MVLFFTCSDPAYVVYMGNDKFENEDKMDLYLSNIIKSRLDASSMLHIKAHFEDYHNERVLLIDCKSSKIPVFLK